MPSTARQSATELQFTTLRIRADCVGLTRIDSVTIEPCLAVALEAAEYVLAQGECVALRGASTLRSPR